MASYDTGYEDQQFQHPVGQSFHCGICYNVVKDPTMCRHNEHLFCRACITRSLVNSQTCPSCVEPLTVETLTQPSRTVMNLLSELKIRCQFFNRGCEKFIELGNLERHVTDCGFAPAVNLAAMNAKLLVVGEKLDRSEKKMDENHENIKGVVANVQEQLNADNLETRKSLNKITQQLQRLSFAQEREKKGIAKANEMDKEPKIVVAGGWNREVSVNSVQLFTLSNSTWRRLQQMKEFRSVPSSFVHNNQIFVSGGNSEGRILTSMESLSIDAVDVDESLSWDIVSAKLPAPVWGHCCVVYNARLFVIGGRKDRAMSNKITQILLFRPYTSKLLTTMPLRRWLHCAVLFGDTIIILGGREHWESRRTLRSVLMYDIAKNKCEELAPLPYPVSGMAAVKWGEENVIIMGGSDSDHKALNKVLIYNIKTQKSHMLPDMKYRKSGCVAAVVRDTVIVMGGLDEQEKSLKLVESFRFDTFTWEELPEMPEAKYGATAVVC